MPPTTRYGALTLSRRAFQHLRVVGRTFTLVLQPQSFRRTTGLGSSRFARHYYGNHSLFSFPQGTEMFHFPWFAAPAL